MWSICPEVLKVDLVFGADFETHKVAPRRVEEVREVRGQVVFRVRDLPPSPDLVGPRVPEPRVPDLVSQAQKTVLKKHKAGRPRI